MNDQAYTRGLEVVRKLLAEKVEEYVDDADLLQAEINSLAIDSLGKLELIMELEDAYSVMMNETDIVNCRTIGEVISAMSQSRVKT